MAIKIKGTEVIQNTKRAVLRLVNFGTYTNSELVNNNVRGQVVGDTVYNEDNQYTMSWLGSMWTNSVAGQSVDFGEYTFSTTSSFPTSTNCSTISVFTSSDDVVAGVRSSSVNLSDAETYTFMAVLKFDDPEAKLWTAWSFQSDDVYTNLIGNRNVNDFPDSSYPEGYSQKQLTLTGDDGDKYYVNDISNEIHINWKSLVYGPPSAFNALESLYLHPEFANLRVSRVSGNFEIKYDESTSTYSFNRTYYNDLNQRVSETNAPIIDANGDPIIDARSHPKEYSAVHLGFLGSAKNGGIFELIDAGKEVGLVDGQTMFWECPEGKSLVGFFYVVKNLSQDISISQALKINRYQVDRASYLKGKQGVGNVIECKPGERLDITIANFDENGMLEYYPAPDDTSWSVRYAVWGVSN